MVRSALITGAGGGLGRGLAFALARRGYRLHLHGRDEPRLRSLADEIGTRAETQVHGADLSDASACSRFMDQLPAGAEAPGLLVHNAAFMPAGDFLQRSTDELQAVFAVNLLAPAEMTRRLCASSHPPQAVLFILSAASRFPQPYNSLYSASKAGLRFLAESLQVELAGKTRVCLAYPPLTDTPMTARFRSPLPKADPLRVAERIIRACEAGRTEIAWLDWEMVPSLFYRFFPAWFRRLLTTRRDFLAKAFQTE